MNHSGSASHTVAIACTSLEEAQKVAEEIEASCPFDIPAISINETDEKQGLWEVLAYAIGPTDAAIIAGLAKRPAIIGKVPEVDWVRQSLAGLPPVKAGRFFVHGSHDRTLRKTGGISIEIDASTAFGTGHHGTTAGCLEIFDLILKAKSPSQILDLGCGTGLLAIAAAKATTAKVLATDIDPEAVRVTRANASLNAIGPRVQTATAAGLHHMMIKNHAPFDLIFANILARPLANLAYGIARVLQPEGDLILSGITRDQSQWIKAIYVNCGLTPVRILYKSQWVALQMRKPGPRKSPRLGGPGQFCQATGPGWEED